jgi:hypothetical protein
MLHNSAQNIIRDKIESEVGRTYNAHRRYEKCIKHFSQLEGQRPLGSPMIREWYNIKTDQGE